MGGRSGFIRNATIYCKSHSERRSLATASDRSEESRVYPPQTRRRRPSGFFAALRMNPFSQWHSKAAIVEEGRAMELTIQLEDFRRRSLERARKMDRGEKLRPEKSITFESPIEMAKVLTPERIRLYQVVKRRETSVKGLG